MHSFPVLKNNLKKKQWKKKVMFHLESPFCSAPSSFQPSLEAQRDGAAYRVMNDDDFSVRMCGNYLLRLIHPKVPRKYIHSLKWWPLLFVFWDLTCHWPCPPSQSPPNPVGVLLLKQLHTTWRFLGRRHGRHGHWHEGDAVVDASEIRLTNTVMYKTRWKLGYCLVIV